jgi:hypothetical protein
VKKNTTYLFVLAVMVAMFGALLSAGLVASAQNSNSSMTTTNSNTNASKPRRPRKPAPKTTPEAGAEMTAPAETATTAAPRRGGCDPNKEEQTDLSGTYTGKLKHGDEAAMDATLTITGNNFTMNMGTNTHSGRIVAVTTCGYTAVAVMPEGAAHAHSLRAKKVGNSLTLMSVAGEPEQMMFTTGGGMRRPRRHKSAKSATPSTPSEAAPPTPVKTPTPE